MPYARFDNFGRGGFNPDSYETGLSPGQWSEMYNADIFNGDLYACGEEVVRFSGCPFQILYSYVFLTSDRAVYIASDGNTVAAHINGEWSVLRTSLGGGIVTFDTFLGTLVINSLTSGAFYWRGVTAPTPVSTWDAGLGTTWIEAGIYQWNSVVSKTRALTSWADAGSITWADASVYQWNDTTEDICPPLPGWPSRARCLQMVAFGNYLVALSVNYSEALDNTTWRDPPFTAWDDSAGTTWASLAQSAAISPDIGRDRAPYLVWWSDAAAPGNVPSEWFPTTSNQAGDFLLQDTGGPITGGKKLRDSLIIYKSDSIYRMFETFTPQTVMAYERVVSRPSIDNPYAVAEYGEMHYAISKAGVFVFDGQQARQIDYDRVHGAVLAISTFRGFNRVQAVANQQDAEIWFGFRNVGSGPLTTVLRYSIPYDAFCVHQYGDGLTAITAGPYDQEFETRSWQNPPFATWADGEGVPWVDATLRGELVDRIFLAENNTVRTYEPLRGGRTGVSARSTTLVRYGIRLSDPSRKTLLRALYPEMEAGDSVWFQIGIQHQPWRSYDGAPPQITWGPEREFHPGTDIEIPLCDVGSVYALRVTSPPSSQFWRLHALGFRFDALGDYG